MLHYGWVQDDRHSMPAHHTAMELASWERHKPRYICTIQQDSGALKAKKQCNKATREWIAAQLIRSRNGQISQFIN